MKYNHHSHDLHVAILTGNTACIRISGANWTEMTRIVDLVLHLRKKFATTYHKTYKVHTKEPAPDWHHDDQAHPKNLPDNQLTRPIVSFLILFTHTSTNTYLVSVVTLIKNSVSHHQLTHLCVACSALRSLGPNFGTSTAF